MILQHIAASLKKRDWGTVVLEIFIVVVGIFIGLQVDDWNEHRKERTAETMYLQRLLADVAFNLDLVRTQAESYLNRADRLERIVEAIEAGGLEEIDTETFTIALCYWYLPENVGLQSATYDELTSTGALEIIRDSNLRRLLQLAWAEHGRVDAEIPLLGIFQSELANPLKEFTKWQFGAPRQIIDITTVEMRAGCVVDREALAVYPDILSILVQLNRSQTILAGLRLGEIQVFENLYKALQRVVENGDAL